MITFDLVEKYNVPVPRYTSYPTVPYWKEDRTSILNWDQCIQQAIQAGKTKNGISLYLHLPFCEQLCTYCGCNKRITKNHGVESVYIEALLKEWAMYRPMLGENILIRELHLGGGTPTFFSPANLRYLLTSLLDNIHIHPEHDFSFEGHPNNTSREHLQVLYDLGFRRVSFGVQDLDIKVQKAINRIQPYSKLEQVTKWAREIGYHSVNYDLIYGLPFQTVESVGRTIEQVIGLRPDRIAFYSYAHVPWAQKSQRAYDENDLPTPAVKYELYQLGKKLFRLSGYEEIGMDHFALPGDELLKSKMNGTLHRNFMGYTAMKSEVLIGLGVSAISDAYFGYRQNYKTVEEYYTAVNDKKLPVFRGINLEKKDIIRRQQILNVACTGKTNWENQLQVSEEMKFKLDGLQADGLITYDENSLAVTALGWNFLRNVCAVFDEKVNIHTVEKEVRPVFSSAV